MASFFFDDYHFPSELYNRETGDFSVPVKSILEFAPHILQELPKEAKDQKPMHSEAQDSWTKKFLSNTTNSYFSSLLTSDRTKAITEFVIRCGNEYMKSSSNESQEKQKYKRFKAEDRHRRRRENEKKWFYNREEVSSTSEEDEEEEERAKEKLRKEKQAREEKKEKKEKVDSKDQQVSRIADNSTILKSAVAASVLSLSLYSTYQASVVFSDISFHNQLELLVTQVQSIIQSTEVWIEEHDKMDDKIPSQIRSDVVYLKEIIENLVRLDPRANKKVEAAGWGCGAVGGLSALGGMALGSATVATGGAALALGGVIVMISAKAQSAGKSKLGARILLENQVRERVKTCQQKSKERERIIFEDLAANKKVKEEPHTIKKPKEEVNAKVGEKSRKLREDVKIPVQPSSSSSAAAPPKKKTAVPLSG